MANARDGNLFGKVAGMRAYSLTKKGVRHRCFLVKFVKFTEHHFYFCRGLLS